MTFTIALSFLREREKLHWLLDDTKEITLENSLHCSKQMDKCQIEMKLFFYLFQKVKEIVFGSANIPPPVEWLKQGLVICNFLHYCCKTPLNNVRLAGHMLPACTLLRPANI